MNEGRGRETILADLFEALVGAIYVDGGMEEARRFFLGNFSTDIEQMIAQPARNWKAELQDYSQKKHQKPPVYKVSKKRVPTTAKSSISSLSSMMRKWERGKGRPKNWPSKSAAENALGKIHG